MNPPVRALIFAADASRGSELATTLEAQGYAITRHDQPNFAAEVLRRERPDLLIVVEPGPDGSPTFPRLGEAARGLKIPSLVIVESGDVPFELIGGYDDHATRERAASEVVARCRRLVSRPRGEHGPEVDPRFLALIVHDLRTPLNVIGLTIRAVSQSVPNPGAEFEEDMSFLQENAKQIEKMLAQLGDYCRLVESEQNTATLAFQPRRFLADFLEEKQAKRDSEYKGVRLEFAPGSPEEVALDPTRVRLAIGHALANAVAAAGDAPVKIRSKGSDNRWMVEILVEKSPPPTISTTRLQPHVFERLIGSAAERRGLDLAIASRVSELFGGSARLDVEPGVRSVITLDWPTRPPA